MPPMEQDELDQTAVLWPASVKDRYGETTVGSPQEIDVRWENRQAQMVDPHGETITVEATVVVADDVAVGSEMWLGELADWPGTGQGDTVGGVKRVVAFSKIPDVKGQEYRRVCGVRKSRDEPYVGG